jgi:aminoglycoside phosphotransferase family enzyme/predicted kinase
MVKPTRSIDVLRDPGVPASAASAALVAALRDPERYPHPVERVEIIETHISWVLLTGRYAYKLKKPLDLGFLDFSTLERRREACETELTLNRRTAPELYLEVVRVIGTVEDPSIGGSGPAIEYAVKMREFPQAALLDRVAARGELRLEQTDELAATVARFHAEVERAGRQSEFGTPEAVIAPARANFAQLRALPIGTDAAAVLGRLAAWTDRESARCRRAFEARRREGFVRECHGDLHLRNLVLLDGRIVPFDCLEFNDALRWIDVAAEVAFVVMDLVDHGLGAHAWRFLDAYLSETGDYGALAVLRFYLVYRAMVRAKIACLRAQQLPEGVPQRSDADGEFRGYLRLAEAFAALERRALIVTRGLSGSGKTVFSGLLTEEIGAIRVRSDVERKRLHGLDARVGSGAGIGEGIYGREATRRAYARLLDAARAVLEAGFPVAVDATFLARADRDAFRALACRLGVPFAIAACEAPEPVLRERIGARGRAGGDASEATLDVLTRQLAIAEPLSTEERTFAVEIDTRRGLGELRAGAAALGARLGVAPWLPTTVRGAA